jgi:predicted ribosomally synthesized peptide with SipW-like signal peptide
MSTETPNEDYVLVHKSKVRISRARKFVMGTMAIGAVAAITGAGTFASFSASTDNDATFNSGTLVLSNKVDSGQTCFSARSAVEGSPGVTDDASLNVNDTDCDNLISTALTPGGTPVTAHVTLRNEGNTNGTLKAFASEVCADAAFAGTSEIQRININDDVTDGTFTVHYNGDVTSALAWNAPLATVETAIETLTGITAVTVSGTVGTTYTVTFVGTNNFDALTVTDVDLDGAGTGVSVTQVRNGAGTTISGTKVTDLCDRISIQIQQVASVGGADVAGECVLPASAVATCGVNFTALSALPAFGAAVSAGSLTQGQTRYYKITAKMLKTTGDDCDTSLGVDVTDAGADGFVDSTGQGCDNPYMNGEAATAIRWQLQLS